jgi:hypothetical protein
LIRELGNWESRRQAGYWQRQQLARNIDAVQSAHNKARRAAVFGLIAGLGIGGAVGLGLGVCFLPILPSGPGLDQVAL